jgi:hypothetical protein
MAAASPAAAQQRSVTGRGAAQAAGAPQQHMAPLVISPVIGGFAMFYNSACSLQIGHACSISQQGFINGNVSPAYVSNGCDDRLWLYTGAHRTGNSLCVNKDTADHFLHQLYIWYFMSGNPANC